MNQTVLFTDDTPYYYPQAGINFAIGLGFEFLDFV